MKKRIEIGDLITFTATTRDGRRKATRKVNGFDAKGHPTVGFNGWSNFVVGCFPGDVIHSVKRAALAENAGKTNSRTWGAVVPR